MAAVVVNTVSYYVAFLVALALALLVSTLRGHAGELIVALSLLFAVFGVVMIVISLVLAGRTSAGPAWIGRFPPLRRLVILLGEADPRLARNLRLNLRSTLDQLAIILLDAATVWVLIRSLGEAAPVGGVYASFMLSTLLRTVGIIPGGLGTYEAASVVTLKLAGIPVAVALSATLLFRGLSFWLPMIPGLVFSRGLRRAP
jgi:Mg2+-importing ATPase